ncbi:MAG: hypothetical protein WD139_05645 [Balneolaceae bacterium]
MKKVRLYAYLITLLGIFCLGTEHTYAQNDNPDAIQPYEENAWYWQYQGEPIMLIGGSDNDNLWQWTGERLTDQLDLLQSVGGNYVRNTMSDRDPAGSSFAVDDGDVHPVREIEDGMYDLEQWNDEYWNRLENFLDETAKRGIIVQLSLWDRFDFNSNHPYHPDNNVNWESGTVENANDFYRLSVIENNEPVLEYQHRYIDQLMSVTLTYDHVLYNIKNESSAQTEQLNYWAQYIQEAADSQNKTIYVTAMRLLPGNSLRHVMTHRDIYSFADVSQNNQNSAGSVGYDHYENLLHWRNMVEAQRQGPMPINNVKLYGAGAAENFSAGTGVEAVERFWKNIFGGTASTRFHRPDSNWGIGLNEQAQGTIKAASMFLEEFDLFNSEPYAGCEMIGNKINADYCLANVGNAYAVYFPFGRSTVSIDPWVYMDEVTVKWLNVTNGEWEEEEKVTLDWTDVPWWGPDRVLVLRPGSGDFGTGDSYIAIIEPN